MTKFKCEHAALFTNECQMINGRMHGQYDKHTMTLLHIHMSEYYSIQRYRVKVPSKYR